MKRYPYARRKIRPSTSPACAAHMRHLVEQLHNLENRLRPGGGPSKIERPHTPGKLTARHAPIRRKTQPIWAWRA